MIVRFLKDWGSYRAGQMLSGRVPGTFPAEHVQWFEEDDPELLTIGEHNIVNDNEVQPINGGAHPVMEADPPDGD